MSEPGERKRAKARRTPERAGRSQGPKGPTASDGGGRNADVTSSAERPEAARRRAIAARRQLSASAHGTDRRRA